MKTIPTEMNWAKTSDKEPPVDDVVDVIGQDGCQIKAYRHAQGGRYWDRDTGAMLRKPLLWKLPDPVADAAPELLAALKELAEIVDIYELDTVETIATPRSCELRAARAAIAKAEGGPK